MLADFWRCQRWGVLLKSGGIWDQPLRWLKAETLDTVYRAFKLKNELNPVDFIQEHPNEAAIVIEIDKLRGLI